MTPRSHEVAQWKPFRVVETFPILAKVSAVHMKSIVSRTRGGVGTGYEDLYAEDTVVGLPLCTGNPRKECPGIDIHCARKMFIL